MSTSNLCEIPSIPYPSDSDSWDSVFDESRGVDILDSQILGESDDSQFELPQVSGGDFTIPSSDDLIGNDFVNSNAHRLALGPSVDIGLRFTDTHEAPLTSLSPGNEFILHVYAQDLRPSPLGVFAAYLDIQWDAALATVTGPIQHTPDYSNGRSGNIKATGGAIDDVGGFAWMRESGSGQRELLSVSMQVLASGSISFTISAAGLSPAYDTLLFGFNKAVLPDDIHFGSATLNVNSVSDHLDGQIRIEPMLPISFRGPVFQYSSIFERERHELDRYHKAMVDRILNEMVSRFAVTNSLVATFELTSETAFYNMDRHSQDHDCVDQSIAVQAVDWLLADLP